MYTAYRCLKCNTTTIIPTEDIKRMESEGRYISCPFGHKHIVKLDQYADIKECMDHDTYKKEHGVTKQIRWSK